MMINNSKNWFSGSRREREVEELFLAALETELTLVAVCRAGVHAAAEVELRERWRDLLNDATQHVGDLTHVCREAGIDPGMDTPEREIVRLIGQAVTAAVERAFKPDQAGTPKPWDSLARVADGLRGAAGEMLKKAAERLEQQAKS